MPEMTMVQAINDALKLEMKRDSSVLIFGEDVGKNGGVFRITENLQKEFSDERVFDTPLAESGIGGLAIGLALGGFRPIAEIQFFGFVYEVMDSICGQASRMRYRSGGTYNCPIVFRAPFGGGVKTPEMHADSLEGLMAQTPGLRVVIPSSPYEAKGLLISSIRDNDPVVFLEHMKLYRSIKEEVPGEGYTIPLDKANVKRIGKDITVITYGAMVHTCLKVSDLLGKEDISCELIDLRTISPIDIDTIIESVKKTNRVVIVQEAQKSSGVASEIISQIQERAILHLEAPIKRITPPDTIYAFNSFEDEWLPSEKRIIKGIKETLEF